MVTPAFREVTTITMKRNHINLNHEDKYGHWWFEIGDSLDSASESFGWWPAVPIGTKGTMRGVPGELNGQTNFLGLPTRDPHHGDEADESFHPVVRASDTRTDAEIADCLRQFARNFRGQWRWAFGIGQNCHTFQEQAMIHCGLQKRPPARWW
jgi:hypothetical protein